MDCGELDEKISRRSDLEYNQIVLEKRLESLQHQLHQVCMRQTEHIRFIDALNSRIQKIEQTALDSDLPESKQTFSSLPKVLEKKGRHYLGKNRKGKFFKKSTDG
jgi:hypothetical protein